VPHYWINGKWVVSSKAPDEAKERRPIYGLEAMAGATKLLIVEGEKDRDFAHWLVGGRLMAALSWMGGSGAVGMVDWSPLFAIKEQLEKIVLVADNDDTGLKCMSRLRDILRADLPDQVEIEIVQFHWLAEKASITDLAHNGILRAWDTFTTPPDESKSRLRQELKAALERGKVAPTDDTGFPILSLRRRVCQPAPVPRERTSKGMREAVEEYRAYGQQPMAMVASSALAAASWFARGMLTLPVMGR